MSYLKILHKISDKYSKKFIYLIDIGAYKYNHKFSVKSNLKLCFSDFTEMKVASTHFFLLKEDIINYG